MGKYFSKEKFLYPFYVLTHPMDGFYEIRHRERGSVPIALIIAALFSFSFSMNRILASFVVNNTDPREVDSYYELKALFLFFFLFCIGNWSITCLMQGEGRFKDIVIAVGYGMLPLVLTFVPATILSRFIAADEEAFYYVFLIVGVAWTAIMILIGIMTVHNYTLAKTIVTLFLTFIAMLIIVFILVMLSDLVSQVIGFFRNIYIELVFRT
ncbi:Yip1 family protein [Clostridium sp. Marseille-P299]|uniref:Yip1 family protein n=1 Tax=Clostridium sp. Marseille-P299 TaxID=1805477 RepID=UPI0008369AB1|nr:Yip1 family protein [Clostridium sp. Marseille-P299]